MAPQFEQNSAYQIESIFSPEGDIGLRRLWEHFENLTLIPRNKFDEGRAREYMLNFANQRKLETEVDSAGNLLVFVPATKGFESAPGIILQGHLDMVCEGIPDPAKNGVQTEVDESGEWVRAKGTTLGADNGIGLSTILALADEDHEKMPHGKIAMMFTIAEEAGLVGARNMDFKSDLTDYKYLFNLDSEPEKEGEATISSAGAGDSDISMGIRWEDTGGRNIHKISLKGLMGGHSGGEIHKEPLNALKVISYVLSELRGGNDSLPYNLVHIFGGTVHNAIPTEVEVYLSFDENISLTEIQQKLDNIKNDILIKSSRNFAEESNMQLKIDTTTAGSVNMMDKETTQKVIGILSDLPYGVFDWSEMIPGHVETSSNVGVLRTEANSIEINAMTRSSSESRLDDIRGDIERVAEKYGASITPWEKYLGWKADLEAEINSIASDAWMPIGGQRLNLLPTHGGLECGVIVSKYPWLQAIAVGPIIRDAHKTTEEVNIQSVGRFYEFAKNIITEVGKRRITAF